MKTHSICPFSQTLLRRRSRKFMRQSPAIIMTGAIVPLIALAIPGYATTVTWTGAADSTWTNDANWNPGPAPVSGDTALFNNSDNGNTILSLAGATLTSILFDTSSAAAYTLGGSIGADTLTLDNGGSITVNNTVIANQTINANLVLGNDGSAQTFTLTNSSTNAVLILAGSIAGSTGAGLQGLAVAGAGATTIGGIISDGASGTVALSKTGAGTLTLTGASTFSGGTVVNGGTLVLAGTSSTNAALRGTVTVNSGATLSVAGAAWVGFGNGGAKITTVNVNGGTVSSTANTCFITGATVNLTSGTWSGGDFHWVNTAINSLASSGTSVISGNVLIRPDYGFPTVNIDVADGAAATDLLISGAIKQTDAQHVGYVVKTGSGTLTLVNNCSYTGTTTVSGGTLQLGNGTGAGSVAGDILNNAALVFNRSDTSTYAGTISGTGSLSKLGAGIIILTGTHGYSGGTTVSAGVLQLGNGGVGGMIPGNVIDNGGMAFNRSDAVTYSGTISGTGSVTKSGAGSLTLTAANSYSGGTTLSTGTLILNSGTAGVSASSAIGTGALTISGGVIDSTVAGVTLGTNNPQAWNGDFTFFGSQSLDMGRGTVTLGSARQVTVAANNLTVGGVSGSYLLTKTGTGTLTLAGNSTNSGATVSVGAVVVTGTYTPGGAITLVNSATAASLTVAGYLNYGSQTVSMGGNTGAATMNLQGSGSMTGSTSLSLGSNSRLNVSGSAQLTVNGNNTLTISPSGGALLNQGGGSVTVATSLMIANTGTTSGSYLMTGGTLTLLGQNTPRFNVGRPQAGAAGVFQMSGGVFQTTGGSGWLWGINDAPSSTAAGYGTLYATGGTITLATGINIDVGPRVGQGDLTVAGGSISLANGSVLVGYEGGGTGIFNLNGGTVQANATNKNIGGTAYLNFAGGTLKAATASATFINSFDRATIYGPYSSGTASYAGGATIDTNGVAVTIPQALLAPSGNGVAVSGSFAAITGLTGIPFVRVTGGGTGATAQAIFDPVTNSMTGIVITNPGSDFSSNPTFNIFGGGISGTTQITGTTATYASGGLTKTGAGMLTLTGPNTYTGLTTVSSGTLQIGNGTTDGTLASSGIADGGIVVFSNTGARSFSGAISGGGSFVKQSAGTLTLSGSNSYTGSTTLGGGILVANSATALGNGGNLAFTGGTLQLTSANAGQDLGTRIKNSTSAIVLDTNGQNIGAGSIDGSNSGGLMKNGLGTLTLSAGNAFGGPTTINGGAISFRTQSALYSGSSANWTPSYLTVASGATLALGVGDSGSGYFDSAALATFLDGAHMGLSTATTGFKSGAVLAFDPTNATGGTFTYSTPFSGIGTSGSIGLGIVGSGTLVLGASNNYTGPTAINGGVLVPNDPNALSTGNISFGGGTLQYTGAISGTDMSVRIKNSTGPISIDTNGQNVTFAGSLNNTNAGGIAKAGAGTLTLTGSNSFTGGATVTGGTLAISSTNGTGIGGAINVSNGTLNLGTLGFSTTSTVAINSGLITNQSSGQFWFQNGSLTLTSGTWAGTETHLVNTPVNVLASSGTSVISSNLMARPDYSQPALTFNVADGPSATDLLVSGLLMQSQAGGYFVKNGAGTMALTNGISTSGTTTINAGTLQVGNNSTGGSIYNASPVLNNATLAFARSNTATQGSDLPVLITGSGNLVQMGPGSLVLNGSNNYTGTTFINGGILTAGNAYAMGASGNITFGGGALQYTGTTAGIDWSARIKNSTGPVSFDTNGLSIALAGNIDSSNTGGLAKSGSGSLTLSGTVGCTGTTTVTGGTLAFCGSAQPTNSWNVSGASAVLDVSALITGTFALSSLSGNAGTLLLGTNRLAVGANGSNINFGAGINGSGGFTKSGSGTLTLSGSNGFTGGAVIAGGTVILSGNGTFGSGPIDIGSNSLVLNRGDFYGGSSSATTPTITVGAGGTLTNSGPFYNTLVNVNLNGGVITATSGYTAPWGAWGLANGGTLTVGGTSQSAITGSGSNCSVLVNNNTFDVAHVTSGVDLLISVPLVSTTVAGFTKNGAGTMLLTGSNSFTGTATVNSGTLQIGDGNSGSLATASSLTVSPSGVLALNLANSGTLGSTLTNQAVINLIAGGTNTLSGNVGGWATAAINQSGSGTTVLSGNNAFLGTTNITAGTLQLNYQYAAYNSTVNVAIPNGLTFGVNSVTLGGLSGSGNIPLLNGTNAVAITVGNNGLDSTYSGVMSGSGSVTKVGLGTLSLSANQVYSGSTTISSGTLALGVGGTNGSVAGNIVNNGTLVFNRADNLTFSNVISGAGSVVKNGTNTLTLTAAQTYGGGMFLNSGTLVLNSSWLASSVTMAPGTGITISGGNYTGFGDLNYGNLIINGATVRNTISSAMLLHAHVYMTGATWTGGEAHFGGDTLNILASSTSSTFGGNILIRTDYGSPILTIDVADGAAAADLLFTGAIKQSNAGASITKTGLGTMVFTGSLETSGTTRIEGGILQVGNGSTAGWLNNSSPIVNNGTIVFNRSNAVVQGTDLSTVITGSGSCVQAGSSTLTLNGTNTFTGDTIVSSGTLVLASPLAIGQSTLNYDNQGGRISFGSQSSITLGGLKGAQSLALTNTASAPIALTVGGNNNDTAYSGVLSGTGGVLVKTGSGTLTLSGSNTFGGGTTVNGGILRIANSHALGSGGLTVNGGMDEITVSASCAAVSIGTSGTLSLTAHSGTAYNVLDVSSLAFSGTTGSIDIGNNAMIVRASGQTDLATKVALVQAKVNAAADLLAWDGQGITASAALDDLQVNGVLAIMVYDNSQLYLDTFAGMSGLGSFQENGDPVDFNQALLKATYLGNLNGDGMVDGVQAGTGTPTSQQAPAAPDAVPEPATTGLLMGGILALMGFRRKGFKRQ